MSPESMAAVLSVAEAKLRGWEAGHVKISRNDAKNIKYYIAVLDQDASMVAAGPPPCEWVQAWDPELDPTDLTDLTRHHAQMERLDRHRESCAVCRAGEQYAKERLPPLPSRPMPLMVRAITWAADMLDRLPAWARPVAIGAVGTFVFTATRLLLGLPMLIRDPGQAGPMLLTLVAGLGVGAAGWLVYSAVRPTFRRLGPAGNYFTGVVCAVVYLMLLDLVVPAALGSAAAESREEWWRLLVFSVILGLVMGHRSLKQPTRSVNTT